MKKTWATNVMLLTMKRDGALLIRIGYFVAAVLVALSALRWYGFSPWKLNDVTLLLSAIQWEHTVPLMVFATLVYFRSTIASLIPNTSEFGYRDGGFYWAFDPARQRRIELNKTSSRLTVSDVKDLLKQVPGMRMSSIEEDASKAHVWFMRNGITSRKMLEDLVSASEIFDILSRLYTVELGRPIECPLDAVAIATWGASLFTYGPRDEVIKSLERQIRSSPEAQQFQKQKHE